MLIIDNNDKKVILLKVTCYNKKIIIYSDLCK